MPLFRKKNTDGLPGFLQNYYSLNSERTKKNVPLDKLNFVALDLETTGLTAKDKIISVGGIKTTTTTIDLSETIDLIVYQPGANIEKTVDIHGLVPDKLSNGLSEEEALKECLPFIGNSIIVGHNISFDIKMLNVLLGDLYEGCKIVNPVLDIALLYKRLYHFNAPYPPPPEQLSLDSLCQVFNTDMTDRHTACGDAFITAQILLKLLSKAKQRGIDTFGQLTDNR